MCYGMRWVKVSHLNATNFAISEERLALVSNGVPVPFEQMDDTEFTVSEVRIPLPEDRPNKGYRQENAIQHGWYFLLIEFTILFQI